jgi:hypothetical protein
VTCPECGQPSNIETMGPVIGEPLVEMGVKRRFGL